MRLTTSIPRQGTRPRYRRSLPWLMLRGQAMHPTIAQRFSAVTPCRHRRSKFFALRSALLDNLVGGGQQRFRDGEAERLGGLEIDDEFELACLHDRQIGWFLAFQNAPGIDASLVENIAEAAAIAHQAASQDRLAVWVDCGQRVTGRQ